MAERSVKLPGLRTARARKGMSQAELAAAANVGQDTISRLETGRQGAFAVTAQRLADALGVRVRELMRDEDAETSGRAA